MLQVSLNMLSQWLKVRHPGSISAITVRRDVAENLRSIAESFSR
jgi:hypothetical protein